MALAEDLSAFVAKSLPDDPVAWCAEYKRPKIIHDSLWGTSQLHAHEIAILDTPLLQRLRFLRQTGATYLTYPSALHTRFEHTLGVLHQASRLCQALRSRQDESRCGASVENNVRFAALMHDTGHGPFSHSSEQFFSSSPDITEIRAQDARFKGSGAGEILSALMTLSEPFRRFISAVNDAFKVDLDCELASRLITGSMEDSRMFLSEIIHGPFDADKLDYMPRDGMFSGLKMHVDLDRLYTSIDIRNGTVDGRTQTRLVGSVAGISPLSQILFNKMLLFTGIYHHHKVRTVDCMLWAIFQLATEQKVPIAGVQLSGPVDFLRLTDDALLVPGSTNDVDIISIVNAIRDRRLWKRALIISRRTVPEEMHQKAGATPEGRFPEFLSLHGVTAAKIRRRRQLAEKIWELAGQPCKLHEVWLDVPSPPSMNEARTMWIQPPGQGQPQTLGDFIPIAQWVELYGMHQWQSHVFCPSHVRTAIGKAAEVVFKEEFGLTVLPTARAYENRA